jgi:hypothetical protein
MTADEGAGTMSFTVSLSAISGQDVSVDYTTTDGTAITPDDYTATSGTLTIPAGSASGTIAVTIIDDLLSEGAETITREQARLPIMKVCPHWPSMMSA